MSRPDCCIEINFSELEEVVSRYNNKEQVFLFRASSNDYTTLVEIDENGTVMIRYPSESEVDSLTPLGVTDLRKYVV